MLGDEHVAIVGDLNDTSTHPQFDDGAGGTLPGTLGTGRARNKIDYILFSPAVRSRPRRRDRPQRRLGREHGTIGRPDSAALAPLIAATDLKDI